MAPTWFTQGAHARRPFIEVIVVWEKLIAELASKENVSNAVKCSAIRLHAAKHIKDMLNGCSRSTREDYALMRIQIRDYCLEKDGAKAFVPPVPRDGDAMQVDAIGFDKPRCSICRRLGHDRFRGLGSLLNGLAEDTLQRCQGIV